MEFPPSSNDLGAGAPVFVPQQQPPPPEGKPPSFGNPASTSTPPPPDYPPPPSYFDGFDHASMGAYDGGGGEYGQQQMSQHQMQQMQQMQQMAMHGMGPPPGTYGFGGPEMGGPGGNWGIPPGMDPDDMGLSGDDGFDLDMGMPGMPQPMPEGPCIALPALSLRQPFASLVLFGVKQLEARQRPALKQLSGPLALHVSHREEVFGSPMLSAAVQLLRRRYSDEAISSLFALPQSHARGHGCIVGIVDVEATWPADLFNEIEQAQLSEQAVYPVGGTFITQLRNPRWLKYPVRTAGSNKLWQVQIPVDALPDGTDVDPVSGMLICTTSRDMPPLYQPGSGAALVGEGDDMGLGLLGGDMVRTMMGSADGVGEKEKKMKKLQKALRQIDEIKAKQARGVALEKTQQGKIEREEALRAELQELMAQPDEAPPAGM